MRVRGDNAPSNAFSLEEQPNKPGVALVRFYENAEPFEEKRDELTIRRRITDGEQLHGEGLRRPDPQREKDD